MTRITSENKQELIQRLRKETGCGIMYAVRTIEENIYYEDAVIFQISPICPDCKLHLVSPPESVHFGPPNACCRKCNSKFTIYDGVAIKKI